MEKRRKEESVFSKAAAAMDLPRDLAGLPRVEIVGGEVYIGHHRGILSYSESEIDVNTKMMVLRVEGENLQLLTMTEEELRIGGTVNSVQLIR